MVDCRTSGSPDFTVVGWPNLTICSIHWSSEHGTPQTCVSQVPCLSISGAWHVETIRLTPSSQICCSETEIPLFRHDEGSKRGTTCKSWGPFGNVVGALLRRQFSLQVKLWQIGLCVPETPLHIFLIIANSAALNPNIVRLGRVLPYIHDWKVVKFIKWMTDWMKVVCQK